MGACMRIDRRNAILPEIGRMEIEEEKIFDG
jgi:hypothetical protein